MTTAELLAGARWTAVPARATTFMLTEAHRTVTVDEAEHIRVEARRQVDLEAGYAEFADEAYEIAEAYLPLLPAEG